MGRIQALTFWGKEMRIGNPLKERHLKLLHFGPHLPANICLKVVNGRL